MLKNADRQQADNQTKTRDFPGVPVQGADQAPSSPAVPTYPATGVRHRAGLPVDFDSNAAPEPGPYYQPEKDAAKLGPYYQPEKES